MAAHDFSLGGSQDAFLNQVNALTTLNALGLSTPRIVEIDYSTPALLVSSVRGTPLSESPELSNRKVIDQIWSDLNVIHRAGLILGEIDPDMIVIAEDGRPWWVDFSGARDYSGLSWDSLRLLADADIESFNAVFRTEFPTYLSMRQALRTRSDPTLSHWYSPAYLGAGLRIGPIWNLGVGWGRWEYILRSGLPDPSGKRILDIGANNGHNALQMLRAGATSVIGIEHDQGRLAQGEFLKRAFEWSDGQIYDYSWVQADMRDLASMGLGTFDMVTALCALYYLDESGMGSLIQQISDITPILVLECNEQRDIGRLDPDTYRRASLGFTRSIMEVNGFPYVDTVAPPGYDRPLVIGHRKPAS